MSTARRVVVIAVGNPMRRDDGAGMAVLERARPSLPEGVRALSCGGDLTDLLDLWSEADVAVVVDAARWRRCVPGEVTWVDDAGRGADRLSVRSVGLDTHGIGVAEMIRLARTLERLPARVDLLALAAGDDAQGEGLSPAVESAVGPAADLLVTRVRALIQG